MKPKTRITFRDIGDDTYVVRMPRVFWLYLEFKDLFPRAKPGNRAWTFIVSGKTVLYRLGAWDYRSGDFADREVRDRERRRQDAEWDQIEMAA